MSKPPRCSIPFVPEQDAFLFHFRVFVVDYFHCFRGERFYTRAYVADGHEVGGTDGIVIGFAPASRVKYAIGQQNGIGKVVFLERVGVQVGKHGLHELQPAYILEGYEYN